MKQNMALEDEIPRSEGAQLGTGKQQRCTQRQNSGCMTCVIGTWSMTNMNRGKQGSVKQDIVASTLQYLVW